MIVLNPAYPMVIPQANSQPKDQIQVALPFRIIYICRFKSACLI